MTFIHSLLRVAFGEIETSETIEESKQQNTNTPKQHTTTVAREKTGMKVNWMNPKETSLHSTLCVSTFTARGEVVKLNIQLLL